MRLVSASLSVSHGEMSDSNPGASGSEGSVVMEEIGELERIEVAAERGNVSRSEPG